MLGLPRGTFLAETDMPRLGQSQPLRSSRRSRSCVKSAHRCRRDTLADRSHKTHEEPIMETDITLTCPPVVEGTPCGRGNCGCISCGCGAACLCGSQCD